MLTAIATKFQNVVLAPPHRSAIIPPTGRISEPISGPRNVRHATRTGSTTCLPLTSAELQKCEGNCVESTWPKANPKPMNDPKVPTYSALITQACGSRHTSRIACLSLRTTLRLSIKEYESSTPMTMSGA